ncbi:hypothetical protein [Chitinophaga sp. Cy-1792]|uniref:hypothetical protein n=1 Tax=Chitinophaga sp. Cy-1792 TaxID=2608339 RepID=UPI001423F84A|nr:hypothetical protein [Chitinophaga sp. Cy-1792]NIG52812.1 hypothetical protein [Chitinophaga sp. Cy-1792]
MKNKFSAFIILLLLSLVSSYSYGQTREQIVSYLKTKNIDSLVMYCAYPFDLNCTGNNADRNVKDAATLKSKLLQINKKHWFDSFFKKSTVVKEGYDIILISKYFNNEGELDGESSLKLEFKKLANGTFRLKGLFIAG